MTQPSRPTFTYIDSRIVFFTHAYSASPAMAISMDNVGAKYLAAYSDADGDHFRGDQNYKLHVSKDVPVAIFWSVTVHDPITGAGLVNGQPFPSINTMDKPVQNADGSFDFYFGPTSPGVGKNWLATPPGKGWFTIFRLYGPKQAFFDQTWKLNDIERSIERMSPWGQKAKYSLGADVFRFAPESRLKSDIAPCPKGANKRLMHPSNEHLQPTIS